VLVHIYTMIVLGDLVKVLKEMAPGQVYSWVLMIPV